MPNDTDLKKHKTSTRNFKNIKPKLKTTINSNKRSQRNLTKIWFLRYSLTDNAFEHND